MRLYMLLHLKYLLQNEFVPSNNASVPHLNYCYVNFIFFRFSLKMTYISMGGNLD